MAGARNTDPAGILLAAGQARRYGAAKLLAPLPDGMTMASASCRALCAALVRVVAVVRPGDDALASIFVSCGARVVTCARADEGMGASLACGVAATADAPGWIVALADMPWILPSTIRAVAAVLADGASIVAPRYRGERGHPVGFSALHRDALAALSGDQGARAILARQANALVTIDVEDAGVLRDVDTPADLAADPPRR